jgi:hypothetical protein
MAKISIRLTRNAAEKSRNLDTLRRAALAAFEQAGRGDIFCMPFEANGQKFALSSRMIIEVDWLPNRIPAKVLHDAGTPGRAGERRRVAPRSKLPK